MVYLLRWYTYSFNSSIIFSNMKGFCICNYIIWLLHYSQRKLVNLCGILKSKRAGKQINKAKCLLTYNQYGMRYFWKKYYRETEVSIPSIVSFLVEICLYQHWLWHFPVSWTHYNILQIKLRCSHADGWVSSVAQSCPTLCDPMNRSTPGLPVHHHLPEFTQTHVHQVRDAIQPFHSLSSPSSPAPNPSQHQSLFQWVNATHEVAKVLELQL